MFGVEESNPADMAAIFMLVAALFALVSLGCVALCVKLYTEFIKEKKYRS